MAPRTKLNPIATAHMARAYYAGMKPSELARDYDVSTAYVIMASNRWDRRRKERVSRRMLPMPVPVAAQPVEKPSTRREIFQSSSGLIGYYEEESRSTLEEINGRVTRIPSRVSLPYVSILFSEAR